MKLDNIYSILTSILKDKVFYGMNIYDNEDNAKMPYIVYQEISKRPIGYHDDEPILFSSNIQITLVTKKKNLTLEKRLEETLLNNNINYSMISEFLNSDKSVNRVYEIKIMED